MNNYRVKDDSVNTGNFHPVMEAVNELVGEILTEELGYKAVMTSGNDGTTHKSGSMHYYGCASDWRIWKSERDSTKLSLSDRLALAEKIRRACNLAFGAGVVRVYDRHMDHLHIDFKGYNKKPLKWFTEVVVE